MQVGAALHMGWVEYCAARVTAARMAADMDANPGTSLVVHNGDISYAECAALCPMMQSPVHWRTPSMGHVPA